MAELIDKIKQLEKKLEDLTLRVVSLQQPKQQPDVKVTKKMKLFLSNYCDQHYSTIPLNCIPGVGINTLESLKNHGYTTDSLFNLVMKCDNLNEFMDKLRLDTRYVVVIYNSIKVYVTKYIGVLL